MKSIGNIVESLDFCNPVNDVRLFRKGLSQYATGVAVVTSTCESTHHGMTINSFSSLSLSPPLVLWSIRKESSQLNLFLKSKKFVINVLGEDQLEVSKMFAGSAEDAFEKVGFSLNGDGLPLIKNSICYFNCGLKSVYEEGDHFLLVGEVESFALDIGKPLLFSQGGYALPKSYIGKEEGGAEFVLDNELLEKDSTYFLKLISNAENKLSNMFEADRESLGLTRASTKIVNRLRGEVLSVNDIEKITFLDKQILSDSLDFLESNAIIKRSNDLLCLTHYGKCLGDIISLRAKEMLKKATTGIDDEDLSVTIKTLNKIIKTIS